MINLHILSIVVLIIDNNECHAIDVMQCLFELIYSFPQEVCNHLNKRHRMGQYAGRASIQLSAQVKLCCWTDE